MNKIRKRHIPTPEHLRPLERAVAALGQAYNYYYHHIVRCGVAIFEKDGTLLLRTNNATRHEPGRKFITDAIQFYEGRDEAYAYAKCACLKKVLDDYDVRFKNEKVSVS